MKKILGISLLAGFYPALFFLSNNWHIFSIKQSLILLLFTSFVISFFSFIISIFLSYLLFKIVQNLNSKMITKEGTKEERIFNFTISFSSIVICIYLLRNTLFSFQVNDFYLVIILIFILFFFVIHSYRNGVSLLYYTFITLSFISLLQLIYRAQSEQFTERWSRQNKTIYDQQLFTQTPNVYLVILESYSNKPALETVYGIKNTDFYEKIVTLGFKINQTHFSNYNHTLASLASLFAMEQHYGLISIDNFDSVGGRRLIENKIYNPVINIFKKNGYKINYLHNVCGLMPNGANVDLIYPRPSLFHGAMVFLTHQKIMEPTIFSSNESTPILSIKKNILSSINKNISNFSFIYLNIPGHSPSRISHLSSDELYKVITNHVKTYKNKINESNIVILDLFKFIIQNDPDSIIIALGDHGSIGHRKGIHINGHDVPFHVRVLDRFGVLAAIRAPIVFSSLLENGTIKSHVNIFKYLFAYLSSQNMILSTLAPDDSYDFAYALSIEDGNILYDFKHINPSNK